MGIYVDIFPVLDGPVINGNLIEQLMRVRASV